jgi:hypothetical protein
LAGHSLAAAMLRFAFSADGNLNSHTPQLRGSYLSGEIEFDFVLKRLREELILVAALLASKVHSE